MIVRQPISCAECGAVHVTRIGAGRSEHQSHRFACRGCGEEIGVGLELRPREGAWRVVLEENAEFADHPVDGEDHVIVNLEADFLIPADQQGLDRVFPQMEQQHAILARAMETGDLADFDRPSHPGDLADEWRVLSRAWSLERNKQSVLARARIKEINANVYAVDPIKDVPDWISRMSCLLTQPAYDQRVMDAVTAFGPLQGRAFMPFRTYYAEEMAPKRGGKYLRLFREFFDAYSEFNQVRLLLATETPIDDDLQASSSDFRKTRMFYGNAYETQGELVDLLALLSNQLQGRAFDTFGQLPSIEAYLKLDKANRYAAFANVPAFAALTTERDNQLRNASHHGGIEFDPATQILTCRAGKGGQGADMTLTYTQYLTRCTTLFMQVVALYRFELILATHLQVRRPI